MKQYIIMIMPFSLDITAATVSLHKPRINKIGKGILWCIHITIFQWKCNNVFPVCF